MKQEIVIVAAMDAKGVIGKDGRLPWPRILEDMQRFRDKTMGYPVIMGRKTYESLPPKSRPLPDRQNIIVTRNEDLELPDCRVAHSLDEAIKIDLTSSKRRVYVIGGGQIYRQAISIADRLFLTLVKGKFEGDTFFPDYSEFRKVISQEEGESGGFRYTYLELEK